MSSISTVLLGQFSSQIRKAVHPRSQLELPSWSGCSQLYKSLKAATPGSSRARNKEILSLGRNGGGWAPADYNISHTTPCPVHFIHISQNQWQSSQSTMQTHPKLQGTSNKHKNRDKQSYQAKSSWLHRGQTSSTATSKSLVGCSQKHLEEAM